MEAYQAEAVCVPLCKMHAWRESNDINILPINVLSKRAHSHPSYGKSTAFCHPAWLNTILLYWMPFTCPHLSMQVLTSASLVCMQFCDFEHLSSDSRHCSKKLHDTVGRSPCHRSAAWVQLCLDPQTMLLLCWLQCHICFLQTACVADLCKCTGANLQCTVQGVSLKLQAMIQPIEQQHLCSLLLPSITHNLTSRTTLLHLVHRSSFSASRGLAFSSWNASLSESNESSPSFGAASRAASVASCCRWSRRCSSVMKLANGWSSNAFCSGQNNPRMNILLISLSWTTSQTCHSFLHHTTASGVRQSWPSCGLSMHSCCWQLLWQQGASCHSVWSTQLQP